VPLGPLRTVRAALRLLRAHWRVAYLVALAATLVNTVPDVVRQVLVRDDPRVTSALLVDVVGFATGLLAQLWVTGAVAGLPAGHGPTPAGALRRGVDLARRAVRRAPGTVATGIALGGGVSALLTLPASVAALGLHRVLGPLDGPDPGAFVLAAASDVVASVVTLPFLALVLVLAATDRRLTPAAAGQ
jgi:fumarate reductase subunit D